MRSHDTWTEDELALEIARLDGLISEAAKADDERSRCAVAYLRQVLRDRRDSLTMLRKRSYH